MTIGQEPFMCVDSHHGVAQVLRIASANLFTLSEQLRRNGNGASGACEAAQQAYDAVNRLRSAMDELFAAEHEGNEPPYVRTGSGAL
jgi:hypothetical protein